MPLKTRALVLGGVGASLILGFFLAYSLLNSTTVRAKDEALANRVGLPAAAWADLRAARRNIRAGRISPEDEARVRAAFSHADWRVRNAAVGTMIDYPPGRASEWAVSATEQILRAVPVLEFRPLAYQALRMVRPEQRSRWEAFAAETRTPEMESMVKSYANRP
jgi:hypothetical protein